MGALIFFDPSAPAPAQTKGEAFEVVIEVAGGHDGDEIAVTLAIDGVKLPTELALIASGVGYAYFPAVVLQRTPSSQLRASVEGDTSFQPDILNVPVVNP